MSKFIIENRTDISDLEVMKIISLIVEQGRISNDNKQYCYGSVVKSKTGVQYAVWTDLNKKSDRFVIEDYYTTEKKGCRG